MRGVGEGFDPGTSGPGGDGDAGFEDRHRQRPADHAGAGDEHVRRVAVQFEGEEFGHAAGVEQALVAGAGVGVAGADDEPACGSPADALPADLHRRGADAVLREDAGRRGGPVRHDDAQVAAVGFGAQFGDDAGEAVAVG